MANVFEGIVPSLRDWVARQSMFFVATAPLAAHGHVNVSPKGPIGALSIVDEHTVAYLDVSGSGAETIAHVRENGRIVVMLCAFEGAPRIVRFHGTGRVIRWDDPEFDGWVERCAFADLSIPEARRAVIVVDVDRVSDSCGYGVPLMRFEGMRDQHTRSSSKRLRVLGPEGYDARKRTKNATSIDGLPAVDETAAAAMPVTTSGRRQPSIWADLVSDDAPALLRWLLAMGFTQDLLIPGERDGAIHHGQVDWPEGGRVMISSTGERETPCRPGTSRLHVVTADPDAVFARAEALGARIVQPLTDQTDYPSRDFAVADPDGNVWTFATFAG